MKKLLKMNKHQGKVIAKKQGYSVIDCELCGFKHLSPLPSLKTIANYYKNKYYQKTQPQLLNPRKEVIDYDWKKLAYTDLNETLNKHIKSKTKRIVDIGCGNGFFLRFMKENGWDVFGIESSQTAYRHAKNFGYDVFNGEMSQFVRKNRNIFFDAVNLSYILEHVRNPIKLLKDCKKIIKKSGIICIETPNDFNPLQLQLQRLGKPQWWISIPDHINYFNFNGLEKILHELGFKIISKSTSFPMEIFMLMGESYITNVDIGKKCHKKRVEFEKSIPEALKKDIYRSLASLGIGRSCIIYAKLKK